MALELLACVLAAYFVVGTAIAWASRRMGVRSSIDYYVAGYRLGGFLAAMTYAATTYSAFMMIGLVGFAYATGVGAFGFEITYLISTLFLLAVFSPRVWRMARERRWVSPAGMIADLYGAGPWLAAVVSIIYLVALIPYATAQLVGIGSLLEGAGSSYIAGVVLGAVIVFLWIILAGVWSVATTDAYQGLWMIAASAGLLAWLIVFAAGRGVSLADVAPALGSRGLMGLEGTLWGSPGVFLAFTLPWIFFAATNPQVVQRLYMPRSSRALRAMIIYFGVFGLAYTVAVTLIGLYARALAEEGVIASVSDKNLVTPTLLGYASPLLAAFVSTSIIAAAVSTLDSILLTLASTASQDLYGRRGGRAAVYATVAALVVVVASIAALKPGFVVDLSVLSSVLLLPLAPVTLLAWAFPGYARRVGGLVAIPITVGFAIGLAAALYYGPRRALTASLAGIPVSAVVLAVSTILLALALLAAKRRA